MQVIRHPSWGATARTIVHRGKKYYWFEDYFALRNAKKDARVLEKHGYLVVISTSSIGAWALHSTFGHKKHRFGYIGGSKEWKELRHKKGKR